MNNLELGMYELSRLFLTPTLVLILLLLGFAVFSLGSFVVEWWLRRRGRYASPLNEHLRHHPTAGLPDLELVVLRQIESLRIASRTAPMLGLVATMIPMGPALMALGQGNSRGVSENLVVAFAAVILALVAAATCFMVLTVRRRWLLGDLRRFERSIERQPQPESLPQPSRLGVANG